MKEFRINIIMISIIIVFSQFLGYIRELLFSYYFGISFSVEAFQIAETIPLVFTQILFSIVPLFLTPLFVKYDDNSKLYILNKSLNTCLVFSIILCCVLYIFSSNILKLMLPLFTDEKIIAVLKILYFLLPNIIFLGLNSIYISFCNAKENFKIPTMIISTLNIIVVIFQLISKKNIILIAFSVFLGNLTSFILFSIYMKIKYDYKYKYEKLDMTFVKKFISKGSIIFLIPLSASLNTLFDKSFSSLLSEGNTAILSYSYKIVNLPIYVFILTINRVLLPINTKLYLEKKYDILKKNIFKVVFGIFFISNIGSLFLYYFQDIIVNIVFLRSSLDNETINIIANSISFYSIIIWSICINNFYQSLSFLVNRYAIATFFSILQIAITFFYCYLNINKNNLKVIFIGNICSNYFISFCWIVYFAYFFKKLKNK